ncbi:MAG: hypothetical protein NTW48_09860 [Chloroflexi bacterium]|nr:hypothetical protein [Chloroflexota bacterium]
MQFEQGPYIQMAGLCDQVIEDKTGALSLIRIIDTVTHTEARPDAPEEMPAVTYPMKLVIMLKSGRARGRHELKTIPELPSGELKPPHKRSVQMEGEERGVNQIINMLFTFTMEGLYWFNVYFDDSLLTRIPLRVKYNRVVAQ